MATRCCSAGPEADFSIMVEPGSDAYLLQVILPPRQRFRCEAARGRPPAEARRFSNAVLR